MADVREAILARLRTLAAAVPGVVAAKRNATELSAELRPGVVVNDGDEQALKGEFTHGKPSTAPRRMALTPEVWILLGDTPEEVGTSLSGFRSALVKAILTDATLDGLTTSMEYHGLQTSNRRGLDMNGTTRLNFIFNYILKPDEL